MNQVLVDLRQFTNSDLRVRCNEFGSPFGAFDPSAELPVPRTQRMAPRSKVTFIVPSVHEVSQDREELPPQKSVDGGDVSRLSKLSLPTSNSLEDNSGKRGEKRATGTQVPSQSEGSEQASEHSVSQSTQSSQSPVQPDDTTALAKKQNKAHGKSMRHGENLAPAGVVQEVVRVELQEAFERARLSYHDNELLAVQRHEAEESGKSPRISDDARIRERQRRESAFVTVMQQPSARWHTIRQKPWSERSPDDVKVIRDEILSYKHPFFEKFSLESMFMIARDVEFQSFEANDTIFTEGEPGAEFFLILSGSVSVWKNDQTVHQPHHTHSELQQKLRLGRAKSYYDKLTHLNDLYKGDGFGELALYAQKAASFLRTATICATSETECLVVRRVLFNRVKRAQKEKELVDQVSFCRQLPHIANLSRETLVDFASVMKSQRFDRKTTIIPQDSTPSCVYFLSSGEVSMVWSQKGAPSKGRRACPPVELSSLVSQCLFGEFGALGGKRSPVSFVAHSEVGIFVVKNNDFDRFMTQSIRRALLESFEQRHHALRTKINQVLEIRNAPLRNVRRMLKRNACKHSKTHETIDSRSTSHIAALSEHVSEQANGSGPVPWTSTLVVPPGFMSRADATDLPRKRRPRYRVTERPWKVIDPPTSEVFHLIKGEHLSSQLHRRRLGIPPPIKVHQMRRNWSEIGRHADETTVRANPQVSLE